MDEKSRVAWGWWDVRSYERPGSRNVLGTDENAGCVGRWDVRSYGGHAIRCGPEFEIMDMDVISSFIHGRRPGSYHVDSERIQ